MQAKQTSPSRATCVYLDLIPERMSGELAGVWGEGEPTDLPPNLPPFEALEPDVARSWD